MKSLDEGMTLKEREYASLILMHLRQEGFSPFADFLKDFDFQFLTSAGFAIIQGKDPKNPEPFVAAVCPERRTVLVNPTLYMSCVCVILLHEVGHVVFKHTDHMFAKLKAMGINTPSALAYELSNVTGDYHISNAIYDDKMRGQAKSIILGEFGQTIPGLVTKMDFPDHPEYFEMDFDQLWDVFVQKYDRAQLSADTVSQQNQNNAEQKSKEYVDGWNAAIDAYNNGEFTFDDLRNYLNSVQTDAESSDDSDR